MFVHAQRVYLTGRSLHISAFPARKETENPQEGEAMPRPKVQTAGGRTMSLIEDGLSARGAGVGPGALVAAEEARARKARAARGVDKYREDNPDDFRTWETKYGCVVQFWGMRVYYGTCRDCPGLVHTRRNVSGYRAGPTQIGRWPVLCEVCRERRTAEHAEAARKRMAELRRKRYAARDEQFRKVGIPVPRQGVPGEEALLRREADYLDGGYVEDSDWEI